VLGGEDIPAELGSGLRVEQNLGTAIGELRRE
jgi:hypothetical protein